MPAPMIPPITIIVASNRPSWRARCGRASVWFCVVIKHRAASECVLVALHFRGEDLFHCETTAAPADRVELAAAVCPDRIREAAVGDESFVVALLIAVVDPVARIDAVAIVLVGTGVR